MFIHIIMGEQSFIWRCFYSMDIESMTLDQTWQQIDQRANEHPDLIAEMHATYSFNITGEDGGNYGLSFKNGTVLVVNDGMESSDCIIIVSRDNYKKLI